MSFVTQLMVRCNNYVASRNNEFVINRILVEMPARQAIGFPVRTGPLGLDGGREPIGLHLSRDLRHIVPEHDNIVLLAGDIADMVAQQANFPPGSQG